MDLSVGSINAENRGAIVGEKKAREWALNALLERCIMMCSLVDKYLQSNQQAQRLEPRSMLVESSP